MTREEAIKILKAIRVYECYPKSASEETKEAIDMAIDALKETNQGESLVTDSSDDCKESESKLDLIRRSDAIGVLMETMAPLSLTLDTLVMRIDALPSAEAVQGWIPLSHDDNGLGTDFPYERDGEWVIVTDGKSISVERIKKDAYDHFFPNGRWFELGDVIAWMPMPEPYKEDNDG